MANLRLSYNDQDLTLEEAVKIYNAHNLSEKTYNVVVMGSMFFESRSELDDFNNPVHVYIERIEVIEL